MEEVRRQNLSALVTTLGIPLDVPLRVLHPAAQVKSPAATEFADDGLNLQSTRARRLNLRQSTSKPLEGKLLPWKIKIIETL
jgi:hypothetical protein